MKPTIEQQLLAFVLEEATRIEYGNGSETDYEYDIRSFRVRRIHTTRPNGNPDLQHVQDLHYHYDPSGNITTIRDAQDDGASLDQQCFAYDWARRLTEAWTSGDASGSR